jgi:hypothetical protein
MRTATRWLATLQNSWCSIACLASVDAISKSQQNRPLCACCLVHACSLLTHAVGVTPGGHEGSIFGGSCPSMGIERFIVAIDARHPSRPFWCVLRMCRMVDILCGIASVSFLHRMALPLLMCSGGHPIACSRGIVLPLQVSKSNGRRRTAGCPLKLLSICR